MISSKPQNKLDRSNFIPYIIGILIVILVLLVVALGIYLYKKKNTHHVSKTSSDHFSGRPTRHDSENSLYGQSFPMKSHLSGRHDSENSLYGQTGPIRSIGVSGRHDSENSLYGQL